MPRKKAVKKKKVVEPAVEPVEAPKVVVVAGVPPVTPGEPIDETIKRRITAKVTEPRVPGMVGYPQIRGGICEFCGVKAEECEHYKGSIVHCSYCGEKTDRRMNVATLNSNPDELIVFCANYSCEKAHAERFLGRKT